jgi:hypothetical protein
MLPANKIKAWFDKIDRGHDAYVLTVTCRKQRFERYKKAEVLNALQQITNNVSSVAGAVWKDAGYQFDFNNRKYFWGKDELFFTVGQELYLCRWLILKQTDTRDAEIHHLYNLRRKYPGILMGIEQ